MSDHDAWAQDEAHSLEEGEEGDVTGPLCHEGGGGHVEPGGGVDGGARAHQDPRHQHQPDADLDVTLGHESEQGVEDVPPGEHGGADDTDKTDGFEFVNDDTK